jgi:hypothetical protein
MRDVDRYTDILENGTCEASYKCIFDENREEKAVLMTVKDIKMDMSVSYFVKLNAQLHADSSQNDIYNAILSIGHLYDKINTLNDNKQKFIAKYSHLDDSFEAVKRITESLCQISESDFNTIQTKLNNTLRNFTAKCYGNGVDYWMYEEALKWIVDNPVKAVDAVIILCRMDYYKGAHDIIPIYTDSLIECQKNKNGLNSVFVDGLLIKSFIVDDGAFETLQGLQNVITNAELDCIYTYFIN